MEDMVNPFPNKSWFSIVCCISLIKTMWEREKVLVMNNFYISESVLYPSGELSAIFVEFETVLKFVVWERFKECL